MVNQSDIFYAQIINVYLKENAFNVPLEDTAIKFEKEILKISRRGSRSLNIAEFSHFTLFCRGRRRNVLRLTTNVHSYCSSHETFRLAMFPFDVCRRGFLDYFVRRKYQRRKDQ